MLSEMTHFAVGIYFATLTTAMEELIKTLPQILRSIGNDPEVATAAAITAWKRAAGDGLRQHAIPLQLQNDSLIVAVADAVWQKQLGAMKDQLVYKVNSILGKALVKRIELVIDPQVVKACPQNVMKDKPHTDVPIELMTAANAIADHRLRRQFVRAATSVLDRRQNEK